MTQSKTEHNTIRNKQTNKNKPVVFLVSSEVDSEMKMSVYLTCEGKAP